MMRYKRQWICLLVIVFLVVLLFGEQTATHASAGDTARSLNIPVLMYHYIETPPESADQTFKDIFVTADNFRAQMQWLKDHGFHTITPDALADALLNGKALPSKPVLLTFDDGYADAYSIAFPILKEMGFTATFFVVAGFIDTHKAGYLNWAQVNTMFAAGMSIECHSETHQNMRGHTLEWLKSEVDKPIAEIQSHTGMRPRFFAYPYGSYDLNTVLALHDAGIVGAFTTRGSTLENSWQMLTMPRVRVHYTTTIEKFSALMAWKG